MRPRATQTDMAFPREGQQAALLKIQEDQIGQQIIRQRMAQVQLRSKCLSRSLGGANSQRSWSTQRSINISLACKGARCMQMEAWSGIWGIAMKLGKFQILGDKLTIIFSNFSSLRKKNCHNSCIHFYLNGVQIVKACQDWPPTGPTSTSLRHTLQNCATIPYQSIWIHLSFGNGTASERIGVSFQIHHIRWQGFQLGQRRTFREFRLRRWFGAVQSNVMHKTLVKWINIICLRMEM